MWIRITPNTETFYVEYSLYCGGATASSNSVIDRLISKQVRWISGKFQNGFIKDNINNRLSVTKMLG